ncbi:MAG: hypothetical protein KGO02_13895 [Alphaproteobacteria bacterium]|nr:hypothetical protein [Alphaproteobacteria bacterium]
MTDAEPHRPAEEMAPRPAAFSAIPQPEKTDGPGAPERRRPLWFDAAEAVIGWFILLILAAVGGALIVVYWPWISGNGAGETAMSDRVSALERQVGQLAAGRAPQAAAASFAAVERRLDDLKNRVDADEARLSAVEKSQNSSSGADSGDVATLKSAIAKNSAALAALQQELKGPLLAQTGHEATATALGRMPAPVIIARLNAALTRTTAELASLTQSVHQLGAQLAALDQRVAQLAKRAPPPDLRQQLQSLASKSAVAELDQRIARIERDTPSQVMTKAAAMLALSELVRTSSSGAPYRTEFDVLKALVPASPALTVLARHAASGAPTVSELARRLDAESEVIEDAERLAYAHNWLARLWVKLGHLVSVRRVGTASGNTTDARLAHARRALAHGDVADAIQDIAGLDRPARQPAAAWLSAAQSRLAIDSATAALTRMMLAPHGNAHKAGNSAKSK